jgi:hypothetical protein
MNWWWIQTDGRWWWRNANECAMMIVHCSVGCYLSGSAITTKWIGLVLLLYLIATKMVVIFEECSKRGWTISSKHPPRVSQSRLETVDISSGGCLTRLLNRDWLWSSSSSTTTTSQHLYLQIFNQQQLFVRLVVMWRWWYLVEQFRLTQSYFTVHVWKLNHKYR